MVRQSQVGEPEMQNVTIPSVDREWVIQGSAESTRAREPKARKALFVLFVRKWVKRSHWMINELRSVTHLELRK